MSETIEEYIADKLAKAYDAKARNYEMAFCDMVLYGETFTDSDGNHVDHDEAKRRTT